MTKSKQTANIFRRWMVKGEEGWGHACIHIQCDSAHILIQSKTNMQNPTDILQLMHTQSHEHMYTQGVVHFPSCYTIPCGIQLKRSHQKLYLYILYLLSSFLSFVALTSKLLNLTFTLFLLYFCSCSHFSTCLLLSEQLFLV